MSDKKIQNIKIKKRIHKRKKKLIIAVGAIFALLVLVIFGIKYIPKKVEAAWYGDSWRYRKKLTIDHTKVSGSTNLTDFPVLVSLTDVDFRKAQTTGNDFIFTSSNGSTKLDHEIEKFDYIANKLIAWVEIPTLSYQDDTIIYIYYGNPSCSSQQNKTGVWNTSYTSVYHLSETSGSHLNSTISSGLDLGSVTATQMGANIGKVDGADEFDGSNGSASDTDDASYTPSNNMTIEAWVKLDQLAVAKGSENMIVFKNHSLTPWSSYLLGQANVSGNNRFAFQWRNSTPTVYSSVYSGTINTDTWYYVTGVRDGATVQIYINGSTSSTTTGTPGSGDTLYDSDNTFRVGGQNVTNNVFDGIIDEVRLSSSARSSDWIITTFNTINSPSTFFSAKGKEEQNRAPVLYFAFDEGYGSTAKDSGSGSHNGTLAGATTPSWQTEDMCVSGKCLYFNGSTASVTVSDSLSNIQTVSFWVKPKTTSETLLDLDGGTHYLDTSSGTITAHEFSTPTIYVNGISGGTLTANQWNHVAVTTATSFSASSIKIGNVSSSFLNGYIDEFKLYDYAKTAAQIKTDAMPYSANIQGAAVSYQSKDSSEALSKGLVGYWKIDDNVSGDGQTLTDSSGNDYDATTDNGSNGSGMSCTGAGKYGYGCSLDGMDDNITISDTDNLDFAAADSFSVSSWFKKTTQASQLIGINHETGDLTEYSSTTTDGGDLSVSASAALAGTGYGLQALIDDTNVIYGTKTVTTDTSGILSARFYVDTTNITMANNESFHTIFLRSSANNSFCGVTLGRALNGLYYITIWALDDVPAYSTLSTNIDQGRYLVELNCTRATNDTSLDGTLEGWIDGVSLGTTTNIDNYDRFSDFSNVLFGAPSGIDSGTSGTLYLDELVVNSDGAAIGPAQNVILNKYESTGSDGGYQLLMEADGDITFGISDNNSTFPKDFVSSTTASYDDGYWHQATGVKNGTSNIQLYIDGQYIGSDTSLAATGTLANNDTLYFGKSDDGFAKYWLGNLDETRIYKWALPSDQVGQLYNYAPGPVGWWKLDEGSWNGTSGEVKDSSGNNLNGQSVNGALITNGKFGNAGSFDGINDYVSVSHNDILIPTGDMTVSLWFYLNQLPTSAGRSFTFLNKSTSSSPWESFRIRSDNSDNNKIKFTWLASDSTEVEAQCYGSGLVTNTWYHLAAVRTGNTTKLYLNSDLGYIQGDTTGKTINTTNPSALRLGVTGYSPVNSMLNGKLDDVKIYNYALTPAQIIKDMNAGHPAPGSPIGSAIAHWGFDEGFFTTAHDNSGNANELTLNSASWTRSGKFGHAWNGTGGDLRLSRGTDSDLEFSATDNFTLSTWFKSDSANNPSAVEYLMANGGPSSVAGYAIYINTDGTICFGIDDDSTWGPDVSSCTNTDYYDGTWHLVTGVRNVTSDTTAVYIDGVLKDSDTDMTSATLDSNQTFYIGDIDADNAGSGEEFAGDMDEAQVFRSALTGDQIKMLYNQGKSTVFGSLSTDSSGNSDNSSDRSYCPPGDTNSSCGPIAHWKLDEGRGLNAYDSSGNGYTGTLSDTTARWVDGIMGKAIKFDGTINDDYIEIPDNDVFSPSTTGQFSVAAWVYMQSYPDDSYFVNKRAGSNYEWHLGFTDTLAVVGFVHALNGGSHMGASYSMSSYVKKDNWYHIAFTYDNATPLLNLFLDGKYVTYDDTAENSIGNGTAAVRIGCGDDEFNCPDSYIDDVRIYNYVRTPAEIAWDYNRGGPYVWYKFDECTGSTAYNSMPTRNGLSTNYDLTISAASIGNTSIGTCSSGVDTEMRNNGTTGKRNATLDFDGSDDFAQVANKIINFYPFSISAWIKTSGTSYTIAGISNSAASNTYYTIAVHSTGAARVVAQNAGVGGGFNSTTLVNDNQWHHIVGVFTSSTSRSIYVDGRLEDTSAVSATLSTSNDKLSVGRLGSSSPTQYFDGLIDEVKVYTYDLTTQQVLNEYNAGAVRFGP